MPSKTTNKNTKSKTGTVAENITTVETTTAVEDTLFVNSASEPVAQPAVNNPDISVQLMEMMKQMQAQISNLTTELASTKAELEETKKTNTNNETENFDGFIMDEDTIKSSNNAGYIQEIITSPAYTSGQSLAEQYIETLANRKSDREVTIVHNCELVGGATTHLKLSNITIDFRRMGEKRVLSWAQFEECASKYAGFFKREIILVADENREVAELYQLPCVKRSDGNVLTRADLTRMGSMNVTQLTNLYNSLTENDKKFMLNYWLGQCYSNTPGFYDRHKIEALNGLSGKGVFDVFIAFMNGQALNAGRTTPRDETKERMQSQLIGRA